MILWNKSPLESYVGPIRINVRDGTWHLNGNASSSAHYSMIDWVDVVLRQDALTFGNAKINEVVIQAGLLISSDGAIGAMQCVNVFVPQVDTRD